MEAVSSLRFPSFLSSRPLSTQQLLTPFSFTSLSFNKPLPSTKHQLHLTSRNGKMSWTAARSSSDDSASSSSSERWLLEPVGDGDSRHIGFKVPLPGAFEIASDVVTVGRRPEQADMVIPVPTVSGAHARLKQKEGNLLITDLDSTNGTFVDEQRLRPGAVVAVPPGSCITFGDANLAMFRVSKMEAVAESPAALSELS